MVRHAQITQNNKFAIYFEYLKKELNEEVDFLHADRHESLRQIDSMILMEMVKHSQSSQNSFKMVLIFLHVDKHQSFVKVYFNTLGIKVFYKVDIIIINPNLGGERAINPPPPCWFFLNNSETVKAVPLAFCSIW